MGDVEITFEREGLEGIVPVGSYLIDAERRFGIRPDEVCVPAAGIHNCSVTVSTGIDLLSAETRSEEEYFKLNGRRANERLACQAKIEKSGELVIMTKEKVKEKEPETTADTPDKDEEYRKSFAEMPLEKKIANLVQLESIALGETVAYVINSPFKIADMLMGAMAELGFRKEEKQKHAARPEEHTNGDAETESPKKPRPSKAKKKSEN